MENRGWIEPEGEGKIMGNVELGTGRKELEQSWGGLQIIQPEVRIEEITELSDP